jgi:hypothetical protein
MRLPIISGSTLFADNNVLDKTPLIYHETKSSIYCLVFYHEIHCRLYVLEDHERNRCGYRMIAFTALNGIHKRVITKVMVEYSESTL